MLFYPGLFRTRGSGTLPHSLTALSILLFASVTFAQWLLLFHPRQYARGNGRFSVGVIKHGLFASRFPYVTAGTILGMPRYLSPLLFQVENQARISQKPAPIARIVQVYWPMKVWFLSVTLYYGIPNRTWFGCKPSKCCSRHLSPYSMLVAVLYQFTFHLPRQILTMAGWTRILSFSITLHYRAQFLSPLDSSAFTPRTSV